MKLNKLFLTCAAVTAIAASMAVSASAADMAATYNAEAKAVVVTDAALEDGQNTILLFQGKNADVDAPAVDAIKYINQGEKTENFFIQVPADLPDGDYTLKVGGENGEIQVAEFAVGAPAPEYTLGDVNANGAIKADDAFLTLRHSAQLADFTDTQKLAADVNGNGVVKADDAFLILRFSAQLLDKFPAEG